MKYNLLQNNLVLIVLSFLLISTFFIGFNNCLNLQELKQSERLGLIELTNQRISSLFFDINNIPGGIGKDILFLKDLSCLDGILTNKPECLDPSKENLISFLSKNLIYNQICILDTKGNSVLVLDSPDKQKTECSSLLEQDSLEKLSLLNQDEIYLSKLIKNDKGNLVLVYGSPIYSNGLKVGYLVAQVSSDYFLEDIRNFNKDEENVFLIDNFGNYLVHKNKSYEFSPDFNFCTEYDVCDNISKDYEQKYIEIGDKIIFFEHLYPSSFSFEIYNGLKKTNEDEDYYWTLVFVGDKDYFDTRIENLDKRYFFSTVPLILIALGIFFLVFRKIKQNFALSIIFGIFFLITYFFLITSFFGGAQNAKLYDDIPDLAIALVAFLIMVSSYRFKDKLKQRDIFIGGLFLFLCRMIQVIFQEYQLFHGVLVSSVYWIFLGILELTGMIFLLVGYGRNIK
jgi:hypothetical protein